LYIEGNVTLSNVTIANNTASSQGGGLVIFGGGTYGPTAVIISGNSTITNNYAANNFSGIYVQGATVQISNSILF
jgi:parallel beta-helix repeat protein